MGDSMRAAADYYEEEHRKELAKRKTERIKVGGCLQSEDGRHCGHVKTDDVLFGRYHAFCCRCDSRAPAVVSYQQFQVRGHGKYLTEPRLVAQFSNSTVRKLWNIKGAEIK